MTTSRSRPGRPDAPPHPVCKRRSSLDATDRALLGRLRADGRASYGELARLVGLTAPSVQDRVRRLEERAVITGYQALVAPEAVGHAHHRRALHEVGGPPAGSTHTAHTAHTVTGRTLRW